MDTISIHEFGEAQDGLYQCVHCNRVSASREMLDPLPCVARVAQPYKEEVRPNGMRAVTTQTRMARRVVTDELTNMVWEDHRRFLKKAAKDEGMDIFAFTDFTDDDHDDHVTFRTEMLVDHVKPRPRLHTFELSQQEVDSCARTYKIETRAAVQFLVDAMAGGMAAKVDREVEEVRIKKLTPSNKGVSVEVDVYYLRLPVKHDPEGMLARCNDPSFKKKVHEAMHKDPLASFRKDSTRKMYNFLSGKR